jgi:ribosomal protein L7Ae-like RNA K-turn-binding protein
MFYSSRGELGHALGKGERVVAAITDSGLAEAVSRQLPAEVKDGGIDYGK